MEKKDVSIQIVRICAMFSIIICHIVQELNNNALAMTAQFFNVGVYIFLFISGYLYGKKEIHNKVKWIIDRIIKLMIPIYLFMILLFGIHILKGTFEAKFIIIYLFDLQYVLGNITGAAHLWFMTVIMICYIITPSLEKIRKKNKYATLNIIVLVLAVISTLINKKLGQTVFYVLSYLLGYTYRNKKQTFNFKVIPLTILTIIAIIIRVISKIKIDETLLYDVIIVSSTQIILGFGVFYILRLIVRKCITESTKVIEHLDCISFYIYITHYMFMVGPIRLMSLTNNLIINSLITLLISYITALILQFVDSRIQKQIKKWRN